MGKVIKNISVTSTTSMKLEIQKLTSEIQKEKSEQKKEAEKLKDEQQKSVK